MTLRPSRIWTGSIRRRLTIGVGGLVALLMAAFVWQTVERQREFLERDHRQQALAMARMLAANSVGLVLANDLEGMAEILRSAQRYPNLDHVIILSPQGRVLGHTDSSQVGRFLSDPAGLALLKGPAAPRAVARNETLVDAIAPISTGSSPVGWVLVSLSESELGRNLQEITWSGLYYTIAAIVVASLLIGWIVRGLMRGVTRLVALTDELARGNLDVRADAGYSDAGYSDDLGALNNAFNAMAAALDTSNREIRESELKYREVFNNVSDSLFLYDVTPNAESGVDFRLLDLNPASQRITGFTRSNVAGKLLDEIAPPDLVRRALPKFRCAVGSGAPYTYEEELNLATGRRVLSTVLLPVRDASGAVYRLIVFNRDVTGQKYAQQELHRREQEFRALVENAPDPILRYDRDCRRIYINPAAERLANVPRARLLGGAPQDTQLLPPEAAEKVAAAIRRVVETGRPGEVEVEFQSPIGDTRHYKTRLVPERDLKGQVSSVLSIYMDVTRLFEAERSLRTLVRHLPDMVTRFDRLGHCLFANPAAERMFGPFENFHGKTLFEFGPPEARPLLEKLHASILRTAEQGDPELIEAEWAFPDGARNFEIRHIPEEDDKGKVISVLSIARDITSRKRAEPPPGPLLLRWSAN